MLNSFARWHSLRNGIVIVLFIVASYLAQTAFGQHTTTSSVDSMALKADSMLGGTLVPPPSSLQLLFINVSAVQILWNYPVTDDPLPITFLVQVSHDGQPYVNISGLISAEVFVYNHMLFGAYYQFQVLAVFEDLRSSPAVSDYFINGVTAPPGPPTGIQAVIVSPWELSLHWAVPATPTPPVYIIVWGEDPNNLERVMKVYQTTHAEIRNLEPESRIFFRMRTDISGRRSILSDWVNVTMPPPYVAAPVIKNHTLSYKWVWLKWQLPPDRLFFNYQVSTFMLCYGNSSASNSDDSNGFGRLGTITPRNYTCPPDLVTPCWCAEYPSIIYSANITGLSSNTTYYFFLKYSTNLATVHSSWSDPLPVTTLQVLSQCCVAYPGCGFTSSYVQISGGVAVKSVEVESCDGNQSMASFPEHPLPSSEGNVTVSGLHPWTTYLIAVVSDDLSPPNHRTCCPADFCSTLEAAPSDGPSDVSVRNVSSRTVTLTVTPPPIRSLNGRLSGYVIKVDCIEEEEEEGEAESESFRNVWQEEGRKRPPCMDQEMFWYKNWTTLDLFVVEVGGLLPSLSYQLQVAALTTAGRSPYSTNVTVQTRKEVYEEGNQLQLEVILDSSSSSFFNISNYCIRSMFGIKWWPELLYDEGEDSNLHNVTFQKYGIAKLATRFCLTSNKAFTSCTYLDGKHFIMESALNFSLSQLDDSILSSLISINWNGVLWVWLDLELELSNGSALHVVTSKVQVMAQVHCPSDSGQNQDTSIKTAILAVLLPLAFVVGAVAIVSAASVCIYKECKQKRRGPSSEMVMDNYRSPLAIWSNYIPLRTGDGQSSRSSSEQSLVTVSTGVTSCGTSTVTVEPDQGNDSDVSSISSLHLATSQSEGFYNATECHILEGAGCRSSPDGCSVSSDSTESRNCQFVDS